MLQHRDTREGVGLTEHALILAALQRQGLVGDGRGWRIWAVPGGLTGRVYAVADPAGTPRWTFRLPRPGLGWRLRYELVVLLQLAGAGLACAPRRPTIVSDPSLPGGEALVHAWCPGTTTALMDVDGRARETLGICLARLHAHTRRGFTLWPEVVSRSGARRDAWAARLGTLRRYPGFAGGLGADLDARVAALVTALRRPLPAGHGWDAREFSLLHGDLSAGNIIWNGDAVQLIDWEYARAGDPAEDLAYLFSEQPLDDAQWQQVAEGYRAGGGDPRAIERAVRYRPLVALDAALWWAEYLAAHGHDPAARPEVAHRLALAEYLLG